MNTWPADARLHEVFSMRKWLLTHPLAPSSVVAREIEGDFERPMIRITPVTSRIVNKSRYLWQMRRTCSITFYGSTLDSGLDVYQEAYSAEDWISYALGRDGGYQGPLMQIYDFSVVPEIPTDAWVQFDLTATVVSVRQDEYGLWIVPADVAYTVEHNTDPSIPLVHPSPVPPTPPGVPPVAGPPVPGPSPGLITIRRTVHLS